MTSNDTQKLSSWEKRGEQSADWRDGYTTRTTFDLADAAYILAGVQPDCESKPSTDGHTQIDGWIDALQHDLDRLLIPSGRNEKNHFLHLLSHEKLRAWCREKNINWPIPENYVERIKALEQELEQERSLRLTAQHLADPVMSILVKDDATSSPAFQDFEPLVLSRIESIGLNAIAKVVGGDSKELRRSYEKDVKRGAELFGLLGLRVSHQSHRRSPLQQSAFIPTPLTLQIDDPEEVYRHLDYLTADQALDCMSRISGHQVEWDTLWGMVGFNMCRAFTDCRAVRGLTYAAEGEHEHRKVFGLGICQIMNPVSAEGAPLHLQGPAIHVDMHGLQEIVPNRSWWINHFEDYDVLFRPSDIENMGQIVNERGGWSGATPLTKAESEQFGKHVPEHSGSELAQLLGKLQISIDNYHDRIRYCVRFEDGRLLAELGADLTPLANAAYANVVGQMEDGPSESCNNEISQFDENEIARLRDLVTEQTALLEQLQKASEPNIEEKTTGITFPYSTRELEIMKAVAVENWAGLDPKSRQPKQEYIQEEIRKRLGMKLGKHDAMPNKAVYLATAIRPDDVSRA